MKGELIYMTQAWDKLNPWPPEHRAGTLSTELWELMESEVIFTEFICDLSLLMMTSAVLILAVCRTPVTYKLSKNDLALHEFS